MKKLDIKNSAFIRGAKEQIIKHGPTGLVVMGVVSLVGAGVWACVNTLKLEKEVEETKNDIDCIHKAHEEGEIAQIKAGETVIVSYTENDYKKDICKAYVKGGWKLVKLYGGPTLLAVAGIIATSKGYGTEKKRFNDSVKAYGALMASHNAYRARVADRFGIDIENELNAGIKAVEYQETKVNKKTGEEKEVTKKGEIIDDSILSPYTFIFGKGCRGFEQNHEYNLTHLLDQEEYLNKVLKMRAVVDKNGNTVKEGHIFMNEILEELGYDHTPIGAVMGITYDPNREATLDRPNRVDLGLLDISNERFINRWEDSIMINIKVDSEPIWDRI